MCPNISLQSHYAFYLPPSHVRQALEKCTVCRSSTAGTAGDTREEEIVARFQRQRNTKEHDCLHKHLKWSHQLPPTLILYTE